MGDFSAGCEWETDDQELATCL